ncbi:MAG: Aurachin C monooxygenase/isomerase [Haliscomenobacter sp.]|nr:Aurachin C monooxygenase/isomerase [Haliscomenobacter sp.]
MKNTFHIVGGGIAGLTAAIALRRIGIEAMVWEAALEFKPVGAGITLAANAMNAYRKLGLYDALTEAGRPVGNANILDFRGRKLAGLPARSTEDGLCNLAIHRAALHAVLLAQLNPEQVKTGKRSTGYAETPDGHTLYFEDGTQAVGNHLIVAEGIHSRLRKQALPAARIRYAGYTCWRGIADNSRLKIEDTSETWGPQGRFGIVPIGNGQIYWFATKNSPENNPGMKAWGPQELLANFRNYHAPVAQVIEATLPDHILWNDIIDLAPIPRFAFGNLVLIGDAAHATTPNMGQGACQAIEDAVVLAQSLENYPVAREAFAVFESRRLKRTHGIVNQSWRLGKVAQWENPLLCRARNALFRMMPESVFQKQQEQMYTVDF